MSGGNLGGGELNIFLGAEMPTKPVFLISRDETQTMVEQDSDQNSDSVLLGDFSSGAIV